MNVLNQTRLQSHKKLAELIKTLVVSTNAFGSTSATGFPFMFKWTRRASDEKTERETRPILLLLKSLLRLN